MQWRRLAGWINRAGGGLGLDVALYGLSALFAWFTAASSTLAPHRAWGTVALVGYAAGTVLVLGQLAVRPAWPAIWGARARMALAGGVWSATALLPLVIQAVQRAAGRTDRAQEEVLVIEDGGRRLLETGTPYLDRTAIAALPESERLLGYLPYQPGMAIFGTPRAVNRVTTELFWWSDARVWFALVTGLALAVALVLLRRAGVRPTYLVRGLQVATVLPVCALTLATGGDDLPVLALCLLALALAATRRPGWAGMAIGAAAALKLFAWPVALVLGVYVLTRGRPALLRYAAGALGIPVVTAIPALLVGHGALVENVFAFPLGRGLVTSPAASPLPGHLLATSLPGGRVIVMVLVLLAGIGFAVLLARRPPRTVAQTSLLSGYGLLVLMLLLPATRFGYLLYPAALLVWAATLRVRPENTTPPSRP